MILITGGCGYIGSNTAAELLDAGEDGVVIIDNLSNSRADVIDRIERVSGKKVIFYKADVRDREALRKIFSENRIDAIIHFAGLKCVPESVSKAVEYYDNNIMGTLALLEVMREYGCRKFVFSSSATVYGIHNPVPFREDMPTSATNPYGWSKVMQEQILRDACDADPDLSVALLRYFNPIGAHKSGLLGDDPNGIPNNLVPYICRVAVGRLPHLNVFGTDFATHDGTGVRDYIHVTDLALGHVAALRYIDAHKGALAVNLGTGVGYSVLDVVAAYEKACGKPIPKVFAPRRAGDIDEMYADTAKAKETLGWEAKLGIDEMCADAWRYASENM